MRRVGCGGTWIRHQGLTTIVSSPLLRARETAEPIGLRTGIPVEIDERLIDRDYGTWAGRSKGEVIARWGSLDTQCSWHFNRRVTCRTGPHAPNVALDGGMTDR